MLDQKNNIELSNLELSVVVPVFNEVDNVEPLILEIQATLENIIPYEMIFIDDCSSDGTLNKLVQLKSEIENLLILTISVKSSPNKPVPKIR